MQELPLLVFTVAGQTAMGAFATAVVLHLLGKVTDKNALFKVGIVSFALAVVACVASLFHLGQPMRAANVLFGLGSSWLSREIVFFGLFTLAALVFALMARAGKDGAAKAVGVVGIVLAALTVVSTSLSYLQPGVPAWDTPLTAAQFVLTVVACGIPLGVALLGGFGASDAGAGAGAEAVAEDAGKKMLVWWIIFAALLISQIAMRWFFFADITLLIDSLPIV